MSSPGSLPKAYGSDRVSGTAEEVLLDAQHSKSWRGRRAAPRGAREHPGSAIEWDGNLYEVIAAERVAAGYRYTLRAWPAEEAVRTVDTYDEASEKRRAATRVDAARNERMRRKLAALQILTGHLPRYVQEDLHLRYGSPLVAPTIISAAPLFVIGVVALIFFIASSVGVTVAVPSSLLLIGVYFFAESLARGGYAVSSGSPAGSLAGHIVYEIWRLATGNKAPHPRELAASVALDADQARLQRDRLLLVEPLVTLLPRDEQLALEERFGRDLAPVGKTTAALLLVLILVTIGGQLYASTNGPMTAMRFFALLVNLYLGSEQVVRLSGYSKGEIRGSALGMLVRPLLLRLLR